MQLINIMPLGNLSGEYRQDMHMYLTHLVEKYPMYREAARTIPGYKILDNSLIELGGAVDLERVLKAAEAIEADEIILPDVYKDGVSTQEAVNNALEELNNKYGVGNCPYKLMAVAHGKDIDDWICCYLELVQNPQIDVVGIPKVLATMHPGGRPYFVNNICSAYLQKKPHHLLGLWYSFSEFSEYQDRKHIRSCDTVLLSYLAKHGLSVTGVRPDGFTVDLENDVVDFSNMDFSTEVFHFKNWR